MVTTENFLKLHNHYEKKALRKLLRIFQVFGRRIPFEILTKDNAEGIVSLSINEKELRDELFKIHTLIGKGYGLSVAKELRTMKRWKPLPFFSEQFQLFLLDYYKNEGGKNITLLTDTYVKEVVRQIRQATYEGEDVNVMRERIYHAVNSPTFYRWQAMRIARTETTFAMNAGKEIAGRTSGAKLDKVWITINDGKARHDHAFMDGATIDQNELFDVGGEKMKFPGDRTNGASASNLINCRCTFGYRAKRDRQGNIDWNEVL